MFKGLSLTAEEFIAFVARMQTPEENPELSAEDTAMTLGEIIATARQIQSKEEEPATVKIRKDRKALIATFAQQWARLERQNCDLPGWFMLKFSCDEKTAKTYADWWYRKEATR